ncbi:gibberellin-regulated protein 6-like [Vigna radiata var. radiata]|uniref:Gibberellin-regulated protein 6-like n=1 Tax=Vigna radiata var. radiata TaxID=3916 RepID=A0A1S3TUS8_VIGRR|nr:gibberellin-regulated protein 6-like [Vigna radiata var. radiata]XP_022635240.1 gibberellin-regulated protein 6-like [Vigna radiata var. radiata]
MKRKLSIVVLFFVQMLLLLVQNHAEIIVSTVEAPAPQPHKNTTHFPPPPQPNENTTHFPNRGITEGSLKPQECGPHCTARCSNTQYKKPCLFFCQKCCAKCLCVPPGTYGNKQVCPCYNNWKTKRGGPKCP